MVKRIRVSVENDRKIHKGDHWSRRSWRRGINRKKILQANANKHNQNNALEARGLFHRLDAESDRRGIEKQGGEMGGFQNNRRCKVKTDTWQGVTGVEWKKETTC